MKDDLKARLADVLKTELDHKRGGLTTWANHIADVLLTLRGVIIMDSEATTDYVSLADGRNVPASAVAALDELEHRWPGATLPEARPAVVAAVITALELDASLLEQQCIRRWLGSRVGE